MTVSITVNQVHDAPVAVVAPYAVPEGGNRTVNAARGALGTAIGAQGTRSNTYLGLQILSASGATIEAVACIFSLGDWGNADEAITEWRKVAKLNLFRRLP